MEGPVAQVQVSQEETWGVCLPKPGTKASENISLISLRLQLLQVIITVLILFWLRFVPVPVPVLVLQLLLQPVFQTQLLLGKPVQVPVLFLFPIAVSNAVATQTFYQNQGGTSPASWESRREAREEAGRPSGPSTGPQSHRSSPGASQARGPAGGQEEGAAGQVAPQETDLERQWEWQQLQRLQFAIQVPECEQRLLGVQRHVQ